MYADGTKVAQGTVWQSPQRLGLCQHEFSHHDQIRETDGQHRVQTDPGTQKCVHDFKCREVGEMDYLINSSLRQLAIC